MLEYSVLMTVYAKENPYYLKESIESILNQTVKTNDFVLVCDGPLTYYLDKVIENYEKRINVIRLPQNKGLWYALEVGLSHCKNELVARMDSDDISLDNRMEEQILRFEEDPDLGILSGTVIEFENDTRKIIGIRKLPSDYNGIIEYSKVRCPFNHPCVMYKKHLVINAGGYCGKYAMEDYHLWIKMLQKGCKAANIDKPLLLFRTTKNTYKRRGGLNYAHDILSFHYGLLKSKWSKPKDFISVAVPHVAVCIMPNCIRRMVYLILRQNNEMRFYDIPLDSYNLHI